MAILNAGKYVLRIIALALSYAFIISAAGSLMVLPMISIVCLILYPLELIFLGESVVEGYAFYYSFLYLAFGIAILYLSEKFEII